MLKKLILLLLVFGLSFFYPMHARAQQPSDCDNQKVFSVNYDVVYDVDEAGVTTVTEQVNLKNLTNECYVSSFNFSIGATKLSEISAFDSQGPLEVTSTTQDNKTLITVKFSQQVVGIGKTTSWTLQFKSQDFAQAQGKVWQITVPKITAASDIDTYNFTLQVPMSFGNPASILPEPKNRSISNGKIDLQFDKNQLTKTGILANFGTNQLFAFKLGFHLTNRSILPSVVKIPLPSDTQYQDVSITNIYPQPENVTIDNDGNYLAWFKVNRNQDLPVTVTGQAKIYAQPKSSQYALIDPSIIQTLTSAQPYWETNNPQIKARLAEIFKQGKPTTVQAQAQLINQYVVDSLRYDESRISKDDFTRLGALTALNNPTSALCSEFTDLFITLARSDGIPARFVEGYAYTSNQNVRPLSYNGTLLHAWPEYYDPIEGWVMVDPTWQNTSGGVDYFSKFDLNHLSLAIRGYSSTQPSTADDVQVNFSQTDFTPEPKLGVTLMGPNELFGGFPSSVKVTLTNNSSYAIPSSFFTISTSHVTIPNQKAFQIPAIPPYGHLEYTFDLRTPNLISQFPDTIEVKVGNQTYDKPIEVLPFFSFHYFPTMIGAVVAIMIGIYTFLLLHHIQRTRTHMEEK